MTMNRRQAIIKTSIATLGAVIVPRVSSSTQENRHAVRKGNLKQSVARWCYKQIPLPDFCRAVAEMGLTAIDLLDEKDWQTAREYGLTCSMGYGGGGTIS